MSSQDNYFDRLYRSRLSAILSGHIPVKDVGPSDPGPGRIIDAWHCLDCGALGELQPQTATKDRLVPACPVCEGELQTTVACECNICGRLFSTQAEWREHTAEGH